MASVTPRPGKLKGKTYGIETPAGKMYAIVNYYDDELFEVFVGVGKRGSQTHAFAEALGRLVSLILRLEELGSRTERVELVIDELYGIGGIDSVGFGPQRVSSVPDGLAQVLFTETSSKEDEHD